jgi:hypothetical protein
MQTCVDATHVRCRQAGIDLLGDFIKCATSRYGELSAKWEFADLRGVECEKELPLVTPMPFVYPTSTLVMANLLKPEAAQRGI